MELFNRQFRVEVQVENINSGIVSVDMMFRAASLDEMTGIGWGWRRGMEKRSRDQALGAIQGLEGRKEDEEEQANTKNNSQRSRRPRESGES